MENSLLILMLVLPAIFAEVDTLYDIVADWTGVNRAFVSHRYTTNPLIG